MAIKLITKTPKKVINYITKRSGRKWVEEQGEELPDRVGEFVRMSRIEDRYQRK